MSDRGGKQAPPKRKKAPATKAGAAQGAGQKAAGKKPAGAKKSVAPKKPANALTPEAIDAIASRHPLGLGDASDLVGAYAYLASDAARWTTGSAIVVDGGYAAP